MMTQVTPAAAWEYCVYVYDENNYGFFDKNGKKHENPNNMKVSYTGTGTGEQLRIEFPRLNIPKVDKIRYTIATTKPGFVNPDSSHNNYSRATDVYPGGTRTLHNSGVIGSYAELLLEPLKGRGTTNYEYTYDEYGRQVYEKKTVDIRTYHMYYTYDGMGVMARREGPSGKPTYLHKDHLGNVTDDNGNTLGEYEYYPFGELKSSATSLGAWRFTSQEWDNDITMYHFPARYYDPTWCRFMTADPWTGMPDDERNMVYQQYDIRNISFFVMKNAICYTSNRIPHHILSPILKTPILHTSLIPHSPQNKNNYIYVGNDPINWIDPWGFDRYTWCTWLPIDLRVMCEQLVDWACGWNRCMGEMCCRVDRDDALMSLDKCDPNYEAKVGIIMTEYDLCIMGVDIRHPKKPDIIKNY